MFAEVLTQVVVVVGLSLPIAIALFIGRERLVETRAAWRSRLRKSAPALMILFVVLILNRIMRQRGADVSDEIGVHLTWAFYRLEGEFVLLFQSVATEGLTAYFSAVYVYGYAFLLVFPALAYFALSDTRTFRRLLTAYSLNYVLGLCLYLLVIAYGPRNVMPDEFLMTELYSPGNNPEYIYLTTEVNRNTNVFPSLHTSLAATVAMFAYQTRSHYPKWLLVAVVLAGSVIISTMYLGMHWAADVVAGIILATVCVGLSKYLVGHWVFVQLRESARQRLNELRESARDRLDERPRDAE